jgi:hypothetical protein
VLARIRLRGSVFLFLLDLLTWILVLLGIGLPVLVFATFL